MAAILLVSALLIFILPAVLPVMVFRWIIGVLLFGIGVFLFSFALKLKNL